MRRSINSKIENKVDLLAYQVSNEAHRRFGNDISVYWYGSWINGTPSERSDLDIGIDVTTNTLASEFLDFIEWVESLPTLYQFDIINMSEISDSFRDKIISMGRLL